jgi:hypothetical protein
MGLPWLNGLKLVEFRLFEKEPLMSSFVVRLFEVR